MNQSIDNNQWLNYLEIPVRSSQPVKLDQILVERMAAFMRARHAKVFRTKKSRANN